MKKNNLRSSLWHQEWCVQLHKRCTLYAVRSTKKGFTMAEILIALTILTIGLVSILSLFPVGLKASKRAGDLNEAALLAQEVLEKLKVDGYENLDSVECAISNQVESLGIDAERYKRYLKETDEEYSRYKIDKDSPIPGLTTIELTIIWKETGAANKNEEVFKTYVADYD